jgi:hypothetical protein
VLPEGVASQYPIRFAVVLPILGRQPRVVVVVARVPKSVVMVLLWLVLRAQSTR